jgi:divalent metal cation (Fe/Co/Zn/Cd) transporter
MPAATPQSDPHFELRRLALASARHVSLLSIAWASIATTVGAVVAWKSGSLLLFVFSATTALDGAGSVALVWHFSAELTHKQHLRSERLALRIILGGIAAVVSVTLVESAHRLVVGRRVSESVFGIGLALCSVVALSVLARWKRSLAARLASRPLLADAHLSSLGAMLAAITVAGTLATSALGWWWVDAAGAAVVAILAGAVAVIARPHES